jgi:tRNA 2-thiouridine synthesizing protein E
MPYEVNGRTLDTDDEGYLLEPDYDEAAALAIAQAEGLQLTDDHWKVIHYLHEQFREHGHTPNFRTMVKDLAQVLPQHDSKTLYDLFPGGPAKQGVRVAGLPRPFGKGGY